MNKIHKEFLSLFKDRDVTGGSIFKEARKRAIKDKMIQLNIPIWLNGQIVTLQYNCINDDLHLQISVLDNRYTDGIRYDNIKLGKYIKN